MVEVGVVFLGLVVERLNRKLNFALDTIGEVNVDQNIVVLLVESVLDAHYLQDLRVATVEFLEHIQHLQELVFAAGVFTSH